jgi:Zn-dependent protease
MLVPVTYAAWFLSPAEAALGDQLVKPDITRYFEAVFAINLGLLIFNVLPIYPLDGGQILQSLLWFVMSRGTSIVIASVIGMIGGVLLGVAAWLALGSLWMLFISLFIVLQAWSGFQFGRRLQQRGE